MVREWPGWFGTMTSGNPPDARHFVAMMAQGDSRAVLLFPTTLPSSLMQISHLHRAPGAAPHHPTRRSSEPTGRVDGVRTSHPTGVDRPGSGEANNPLCRDTMRATQVVGDCVVRMPNLRVIVSRVCWSEKSWLVRNVRIFRVGWSADQPTRPTNRIGHVWHRSVSEYSFGLIDMESMGTGRVYQSRSMRLIVIQLRQVHGLWGFPTWSENGLVGLGP